MFNPRFGINSAAFLSPLIEFSMVVLAFTAFGGTRESGIAFGKNRLPWSLGGVRLGRAGGADLMRRTPAPSGEAID